MIIHGKMKNSIVFSMPLNIPNDLTGQRIFHQMFSSSSNSIPEMFPYISFTVNNQVSYKSVFDYGSRRKKYIYSYISKCLSDYMLFPSSQ